MCRAEYLEYLDSHERKFVKSPGEKAQEEKSTHISKVLAGQLSYTTEEYIQ